MQITIKLPEGETKETIAELIQSITWSDEPRIAAIIDAIKNSKSSSWVKASDRMPDHHNAVPIFPSFNGEEFACWNDYDKCWDTLDGDDYLCDKDTVIAWYDLPENDISDDDETDTEPDVEIPDIHITCIRNDEDIPMFGGGDKYRELVVGQRYVIDTITVGDSRTFITLRGKLGRFNSVLFADSETEKWIKFVWNTMNIHYEAPIIAEKAIEFYRNK